MHESFIEPLLIVLTTGLLAGTICRRISLPPLMGYLLLGTVLSEGVLGWVSADVVEIAHLAELGVFFLLFSIGLELSLEEIRRMGRHLIVGGSIQMLFVAFPIAMLLVSRSWEWNAAILVAAALAFSSTVLVFRLLGEMGQTSTPIGRRAISILLFQDAALVPLLLCIPLMAGTGEAASFSDWATLAAMSLAFVIATILLRFAMNGWVIPHIAQHRSPDLVILMTLTILGVVTLVAHRIGLPPALGAFAAGLAFGGNRWSEQVDSLILPFREAFAAVFFVSLGLLIDVSGIVREPLFVLGAVLLLMTIKAAAAVVALKLTGMQFTACLRPAVSLAHVGEFAFVLILVGGSAGVISPDEQRRLVTIAGATLLVAPILIRWGLAIPHPMDHQEHFDHETTLTHINPERHYVVIGMGPVGRAVAARLETLGYEVTAVDSNPLNLQAFAHLGIATVAGDAQQERILQNAGAEQSRGIVICVPIDEVAHEITRQARRLNRDANVIVRCRYAQHVKDLQKAGANIVISEEARSTRDLVEAVEKLTGAGS